MGQKRRHVKTGRTRFHLSRGGETALAGTGVVILIVAAAALVLWGKSLFFQPSAEEAARHAEVTRAEDAELARLEAAGAVLAWTPGVETLTVDRAKWLAEPLAVRERAAKALTRKVGLELLLFNDPAGARVAWVERGKRYKEPAPPPGK